MFGTWGKVAAGRVFHSWHALGMYEVWCRVVRDLGMLTQKGCAFADDLVVRILEDNGGRTASNSKDGLKKKWR